MPSLVGVARLMDRVPTSTGAAPATFYLLQEDGASKFTLEDGSGFLLLETAP